MGNVERDRYFKRTYLMTLQSERELNDCAEVLKISSDRCLRRAISEMAQRLKVEEKKRKWDEQLGMFSPKK